MASPHDDDHGRSPRWTLTLAQHEGLLVVLGDGHWRAVSDTCPWPPPAGRSALPSAITRALRAVTGARLALQLPVELDAWPWEREIADAGIVGRALPRYLTDLPPASDGDVSPTPLVGCCDRRGDYLADVRSARRLGRPLVLTDPELPSAQREALEQALRQQWRDPLTLAEALEAACLRLGLPIDSCRLYGDGRAGLVDLETGWRPVTALSIDVVKSTPLLQAIGPERYAQRLLAYHLRCREVILRFHGSLDVPQGDDGLMAYFGFPLAIEDAAVCALRAAWELSRGMLDLGLEVRVGIASGTVVVRSQQAFGDELHLAARLRAAAKPGQVFVAPSTCERVGSSFQLTPLEQGASLKDYADIKRVYRLDAIDEGHRHATAARFVGRGAELERLREGWRSACAGRLQWYVVQGDAGIGKSRLLQEFARELVAAGHRCVELVGQAHAEHTPFAAMVDALRRLAPAGAERAGSPHGVAEGLQGPAGWSRERLIDLLIEELRPGPACLLVDDAHWLDPSTMDLLRALRERCARWPLLVLVGERPESGRAISTQDAVRLPLLGFNADEAAALVHQLGGSLPAAVVRRVVERAEGVPLYLEEFLRVLQHSGAAPDDFVPPTLEDLLMVRLDSLGPDRELAQLFSLLGRECTEAQLRALLAQDDPFVAQARRRGSLTSLLHSGLLQAQDRPAGYRFKHALIRDAAYRSMATDVRRRLHGLCADLIEAGNTDDWPERAEQLARHHEAAGRLARARLSWLAAAQGAAARQAHQEALDLARRALALGPHADAPDRARDDTALQLLIASAHVALDGYGSPEVEKAYLAAEQAGRGLADPEKTLRTRLGLEACYVMRGDLARAHALACSAVDTTAWDRNPRLALQARWALANVLFHRGDWREALAGFDDCLEHYRPALHRRSGVQDPAVMCLGYSSWIHFEIGNGNEALRRIERALQLARELDHPFSTSVALGFAASVTRLCGDAHSAWPHAVEAVEVCERAGFGVWLSHAWMVRGQLRADRGDVQGGDDDMDRGYASWHGGGARISCATYLITRAEILLRQGRSAQAKAQLAEAWQISEAIGEHYYRAEWLRLRGLLAWQTGDAATADAHLRDGLARAQREGRAGLALRCGLSLGAWEVSRGLPASVSAARLRVLLEAVRDHTRCRDVRWARTALDAWERGQPFASLEKTPWEPR